MSPVLDYLRANYVSLGVGLFILVEVVLKAIPARYVRANSALEFVANILRRIPAIGIAVQPLVTPPPAPPTLLELAEIAATKAKVQA